MKLIRIPYNETGLFSPLVDQYLNEDKGLSAFYSYAPKLESFSKAIKDRQQVPVNRDVLHEVLIRQYGSLLNSRSMVAASIDRLKNQNTFTVTTGHQLNIFSGPLFSIYKIISVIKLTQELKSLHPTFDFVPVFWLASEDHDKAEIDHLSVYGKDILWKTDQTGAVGRFKPSGLEFLADEILSLLGDSAAEMISVFREAYSGSDNLSEATRKIMHTLFGRYGLVVLDADDFQLKGLFADIMRKELLDQISFPVMNKTNERFSDFGKIQVKPREINLFYIKNGIRERITGNRNTGFSVLNTDLYFNEQQILQLLHQHPDAFSPNVVLRPVYQESVLPNLAYIGGPGELNYWLQIKDVFDAYGAFYPVVLLRSSFMLVNRSESLKFEKLGLSFDDIFKSSEQLTMEVLERQGSGRVDASESIAEISRIYQQLEMQWGLIDATLKSSVEAEKMKSLKAIASLEEKARRALKRKNEVVVGQIVKLRERLMPGGAPQERVENFMVHNLAFEQNLLDLLLNCSDPIAKDFMMIVDDSAVN